MLDFNPTIVTLQETFLNATKTTVFKNYSFYSRPGEESNGTVHGGVALLVNNAVPHSHIQLNTTPRSAFASQWITNPSRGRS